MDAFEQKIANNEDNLPTEIIVRLVDVPKYIYIHSENSTMMSKNNGIKKSEKHLKQRKYKDLEKSLSVDTSRTSEISKSFDSRLDSRERENIRPNKKRMSKRDSFSKRAEIIDFLFPQRRQRETRAILRERLFTVLNKQRHK